MTTIEPEVDESWTDRGPLWRDVDERGWFAPPNELAAIARRAREENRHPELDPAYAALVEAFAAAARAGRDIEAGRRSKE